MHARHTTIVAAAVLALLVAPLLTRPAVEAAPRWAPAATASIHPGVETVTAGGQCTANFVFYDATDIYIGQAAHCSSTGAPNETNGCTTGSRPLGTKVTVDGAAYSGTMVYNSWLAMQKYHEIKAERCQYNDFALIRLDRRDHKRVNPSIPFWGGPTGIATATRAGDEVLSYGNSSLRLGLSPLSPKDGISLGDGGGGWTHSVYTVSPGIPGDSGSAFLDARGRALGVLSTVELFPQAGSNGVSNLNRSLGYMKYYSSLRVTLAVGTKPFTGGLVTG